MDSLELLTADHDRVRGVVERLRVALDDGSNDAITLAATLLEELRVHTGIEEQLFYPSVRALDPRVDELVAEGLEEHHVADLLMSELAALTDQDDTWKPKLEVLMENVEHHADEEEQELFPLIRRHLDQDDHDALVAGMEEIRARLGARSWFVASDLTKEELVERARELRIPGRSSMSKERLAATVGPAAEIG